MPAPGSYTYEPAALIAAHQSFADLIDAGVGNGKIQLRDNSDVLLATIPLNASNVVNGTTGQLTITASGPDTAADADGTCTYGEIRDGSDVLLLSLPAQAGGAPVSGYVVLNSVAIVTGAEVSLISCTIG